MSADILPNTTQKPFDGGDAQKKEPEDNTCTACQKPITEKVLKACGGKFHVNCFVCESCKKSLEGTAFTMDDQSNVHCVPCYHEKFAPKCAACKEKIIPKDNEKESYQVIAMDKSFHVDCYKCEDCSMKFNSEVEDEACYPMEEHLLCKKCHLKRRDASS